MDNLLISNFSGFVTGLLVAVVFWLIFARILVPNIKFSDSISKRFNDKSGIYDYCVRFKNIGSRGVISIECIARFIVDWEGHGTWSATYIPMNSEGTRKTELPKIGSAKNLPESDAGTRTMPLYPNLVQAFKSDMKYPEEFRKKAKGGELELKDLFELGTGAELKIYIFGFDEFSGARRLYESKYYKSSDIKLGKFEKKGLCIKPNTASDCSSSSDVQPII